MFWEQGGVTRTWLAKRNPPRTSSLDVQEKAVLYTEKSSNVNGKEGPEGDAGHS